MPDAIRAHVNILNAMQGGLEQGPWLAGDTYSLAEARFAHYGRI